MKTDARTGRKGIDKKSPLPLTDAESITGEALAAARPEVVRQVLAA